jgi:hypothetical protein
MHARLWYVRTLARPARAPCEDNTPRSGGARRAKSATVEVDKIEQRGDQGPGSHGVPPRTGVQVELLRRPGQACSKRCNILRASQGGMVGRVLARTFVPSHSVLQPRQGGHGLMATTGPYLLD